MKRVTRIVIAVALFALLPAALLAQDEEPTLAGLAEQLAALVERVEAIETAIAPPSLEDGTCVLHLDSSTMQRETLTKYLDTFDEEPSSMILSVIYYNRTQGKSSCTSTKSIRPVLLSKRGTVASSKAALTGPKNSVASRRRHITYDAPKRNSNRPVVRKRPPASYPSTTV